MNVDELFKIPCCWCAGDHAIDSSIRQAHLQYVIARCNGQANRPRPLSTIRNLIRRNPGRPLDLTNIDVGNIPMTVQPRRRPRR